MPSAQSLRGVGGIGQRCERRTSRGAARPGWGGLARRVRCAGARQEPDQPRTMMSCEMRFPGEWPWERAKRLRDPSILRADPVPGKKIFLSVALAGGFNSVEPSFRGSVSSRSRREAPGGDSGGAGGEGGIRTLEALARLTVFETARFSHSRTSPGRVLHELTRSVQPRGSGAGYRTGYRIGPETSILTVAGRLAATTRRTISSLMRA